MRMPFSPAVDHVSLLLLLPSSPSHSRETFPLTSASASAQLPTLYGYIAASIVAPAPHAPRNLSSIPHNSLPARGAAGQSRHIFTPPLPPFRPRTTRPKDASPCPGHRETRRRDQGEKETRRDETRRDGTVLPYGATGRTDWQTVCCSMVDPGHAGPASASASASAHAQHQVIAFRHISTPRLTPLASRDSHRPGLAVMIFGRIPYMRTSSHLPNAKISHGHQPVPMMEIGSDAPDVWIAVATEPARAAGRKTRDDRSP
ncbi:hypothetical protein CSOJ01_09960 [Colletotrichum sojae]|uniref:Uncharacterized protein n=1 Tax=Colletotrichum sojae TaxID=2175907 RepID=A0A8H6MQS8_9PEZI|nr:hypothetical protein CSOJ01_09960 [Colletotrichum sojae]